MAGRVWPRHGHRGRPLKSVVRAIPKAMPVESASQETRQSQVSGAANDHAVRAVGGVSPQGPRDAAAQSPWPREPRFQFIQWETFSRLADPFEAYIVAGGLNAEDVPTTVIVTPPGVDFSHVCEIWVPRELMHRARWVLAWPPVSEAELTFLATGEIVGSEDGPL
jgi:hypothetical protein